MIDSATFWDGVADRYATRAVDDPEAYEYTLERTRSHLAPGDHVLELGCGTGTTALRLADAVTRYTGSDLSGRMIAIARDRAAAQGGQAVDFTQAGVSDRFGNAGGYDAVVAMNLLHLLPDTAEAAAKVHALLRPGGLFISKTLCRPQGAWPWKLGLMRAALPVLQLLGKAPMVRFMSVQQLEAAITGAGFQIIETGNYPAEPPRRFIVARKL